MPEENVEKRVKQDRVPYDVWIREGFIQTTDGNVVDYDLVKAHIMRARGRFEIEEIAFDPWNATQIATQLQGEGLTTVEFRQGFASMTEPTKELMGLGLGLKLVHLGNPVLRWMASNLVVRRTKRATSNRTKKVDGRLTASSR